MNDVTGDLSHDQQEMFKRLRAQLGVDNAADSVMPEADPYAMPTMGSFMSAFEEHKLEELAKNYKLTPATLAYRLENKRLGPDDPLKWFPSPFLMNVSLRIAMGVAKGGYRGILSAPPRHGKSRLSTIHGPLWILENFANQHVVTTTYGSDLAEDFARIVRDYIWDNTDDLSVRIRTDASKIQKFLTNKGGALTSIGIGGPITGRGANVLFIDDYIKQIKEANSPTYRDYVYDWFTTTAMTRLEPGASVIIVATRWHHDDLIGRILRNFGTLEEGGDWDYIKYHATARENDPLGRKPGEALFPERYPVKILEERKKLLGTFYYDAIFDQEPHETTSDLTNKDWIKKININLLPDIPFRLARVWDFAGTEEQKADFTCGGLVAGDGVTHDMYLLNMIRKQLTAGKVETLVKKTAEDDGKNIDVVICQETGSAGKAVVAHYATNVLPGYRVHGYYWNTNKQVVAQPWLACCEAGQFYILEAPWNQVFIDEFGSFPSDAKGVHDDQIDVCANGHIFLFGKKKKKATWARNSKSLITDPVQIAQAHAQLQENSPHRALGNGKKWSFGSISGATFGKKLRNTRYL